MTFFWLGKRRRLMSLLCSCAFDKTADNCLDVVLQTVRTSFRFHLRECMGSCSPPPPGNGMDKSYNFDVHAQNTVLNHEKKKHSDKSWAFIQLESEQLPPRYTVL